jgi:cytochrome c
MWGKGTNNILGAVLVALWLLWGVNTLGDMLIPHVEAAKSEGTEMAAATSGPKEPAEPVQPLPVLLAEADIDKGKTVAKKCVSCHTFEKGQANKVGPNLYGIYGGPHAHMEGFNYSNAMKGKDGPWTAEDLDAFLAKPTTYLPGTKMAFAGISKASERAALIKYLNSLADAPKPLPQP